MRYLRRVEKVGTDLAIEVVGLRTRNASLTEKLRLAHDSNRAYRASEDRLQQQIDEQAKEIDRLRAKNTAAARARDLHARDEDADYCTICSDHGDINWPCATVSALNGEGPSD